MNKKSKIKEKYNMQTIFDADTAIETIKQKVGAKAACIARYERRI